MPRYYEIGSAFRSAIKRNEKGQRQVSTEDFVRELAEVNHHWTLQQANTWIEHYQNFFMELSDDGKGNRVFLLRSMGYVR